MKYLNILLLIIFLCSSCSTIEKRGLDGTVVDMDVNTAENISALFNAVNRGDTDTAENLLELGVYPDIIDCLGSTLLIQAIYLDNKVVARALLEHGADPYKENFLGADAFKLADKWQKKDMVDLLKEYENE
jgi:ankyrin repeat protein